MAKRDLEELFSLVKAGDEVEIRGDRDEQTAAIFGTGSSADQTTVAVAQNAASDNESIGQ